MSGVLSMNDNYSALIKNITLMNESISSNDTSMSASNLAMWKNLFLLGEIITGIVLFLSYIYMLLIFLPFHKSHVKTFGIFVANLMIIFPINFLFLRGTMTAHLIELAFYLIVTCAVFITSCNLLHSTEELFEYFNRQQTKYLLYSVPIFAFCVYLMYNFDHDQVVLASMVASLYFNHTWVVCSTIFKMRKDWSMAMFVDTMVIYASIFPSIYYFFLVWTAEPPTEDISVREFLFEYYSYLWLPLSYPILSLFLLCTHKRKKINFKQIMTLFSAPEVNEKPEILYI